MSQGWRRGLPLALAAFVCYVLTPALPVLLLPFTFLAVGAFAVLFTDASHHGPAARRATGLGLALGAGGFLLLLATNAVAFASLNGGELDRWKATLWLRLASEAAVAGGFYLAAAHLAGARSRPLLGLAVGAAVAVAALAAVISMGPAEALAAEARALPDAPGSEAYRAWADRAYGQFLERVESANLAKVAPYVLFAWAYATILGRLRAEPPRPGGAP